MTIRAKFKCATITRSHMSVNVPKEESPNGYKVKEVHTVEFQVAGDYGSAENKRFYASSPSGSIKLTTVHEGLFDIGKEYYVDFTEAL